jgi:hypothetical protein
MARTHSRSRVRLFIEHLEDRAQPAQLNLLQTLDAAVLEPVANLTPAILGDRTAGTPNITAAPLAAGINSTPAPAAAGNSISVVAIPESAFIVFFGPSDQADFAVLVQPVQFTLPSSNILPMPGGSTAGTTEIGFRVVFLNDGFVGQTEADFLRSERVVPALATPIANAPEHSAETLAPSFVPPAATQTVTLLGVPIGYGSVQKWEEAPMPHLPGEQPAAPGVEIAPPPREVDPAANLPKQMSQAPQTTEEVSAPAAAAAVASNVKPSAVEQPETAGPSWGWFGAFAAALAVGGCWVLNRGRWIGAARRVRLRGLRLAAKLLATSPTKVRV